MNDTIIVLKKYAAVLAYLSEVRKAADSERSALGFFPAAVYEEFALQNKLWVAVDPDSKAYLGHLLFATTYPKIVVRQMFVGAEYRKNRIARTLVDSLSKFGEANQYTSIVANVATDLIAANRFWESVGFVCIRRRPGGQSRQRQINIRVRSLATATLFDAAGISRQQQTGTGIPYRPLNASRSYVVDVNVLIDALRNQSKRSEAAAVFNAGLNNFISVWITAEFVRELERNSAENSGDPLLEFARSLPVLEEVSNDHISNVVDELRDIVFPEPGNRARSSPQGTSDLKHLATSIHYRSGGFVTSEKAILRAAPQIETKFGLRIVAPAEFLEPSDADETRMFPSAVETGGGHLSIVNYQPNLQASVDTFFADLGLPESEMRAAWRPSTLGANQVRYCAFLDNNLIATCSWGVPIRPLEVARFYLYVEEDRPCGQSLIDHFLEKAVRELGAFGPKRIFVHLSVSQGLTKETALRRGFQVSPAAATPPEVEELWKISARGAIFANGWADFREALNRITGAALPNKLPAYKIAESQGVDIISNNGSKQVLSIFTLETQVSPVLFLFPGREGVLVPIRRTYGEELVSVGSEQKLLLSTKEAHMISEKAYFRSPKKLKIFCPGMPVVFYESGHRGGRKAAIGSGRITFSDTLERDQSLLMFQRQGVLDESALRKLLAKHGKVHVFTFDNFQVFDDPIPFQALKKIGCVDRSNLVSPMKLHHEHLCSIFERSFSSE